MRNLLAGNPVIPVITLDRVDDAVPLAQALVAGGLKVLEVTLRTEAAIEGIKEIIKQPEIYIKQHSRSPRNTEVFFLIHISNCSN